MNRLKLAVVTCGFLGCSPVAPGTAGTLGGVLLAWLFSLGGGRSYAVLSLVACALLYAVGRSLGDWAERHAGRKDPGIFVLDEVIGYLLTMLWWSVPSPLALAVGFFVFRFLDVVKPWPARRMERMGGGDGILLDDVVAGLYGLALMAGARWVLPDLPWSTGG